MTNPHTYIGILLGLSIVLTITTQHYLHQTEYYRFMYDDAESIIHDQSLRIDGLADGDCQLRAQQ